MQDATVQSTPQMNQAPAVAPSSYVAPAPQQQAPQAPVQYQVGTSYPQAVPQVAPQGVTSYQSNPSQYAPQSQPAAPQSNPWETAFNKVVNLLGSPVPSPFQGQQSQQINPTQYTPANYGQPSVQATPQSAPQTWSTNQTSFNNSSQTLPNGWVSRDSFVEASMEVLGLSDETRMVTRAYGVEAPAILNQYALNLEGVLDSAIAWGKGATETLKGYANFAVNEHQENLAYNEILTNPDVLSDYTLQFFGPEGPYPVYENEAQLETPGYQTQAVTPGMGQFPAPPTAAAPQQPQNFWESFKSTMDRDPQNAWRVINQATPDVIANKLFVME